MTKPYNTRNLKGRPFLVVHTVFRPNKGVRTEKPGWANTEGAMAAFEQPSVVDQVTPKIMQSATVIVDVLESRIVKCRYEGEPSEIIRHYVTTYADQIQQSMRIWIEKYAAQNAATIIANEDAASSP
jgi:hypothetical protein